MSERVCFNGCLYWYRLEVALEPCWCMFECTYSISVMHHRFSQSMSKIAFFLRVSFSDACFNSIWEFVSKKIEFTTTSVKVSIASSLILSKTKNTNGDHTITTHTQLVSVVYSYSNTTNVVLKKEIKNIVSNNDKLAIETKTIPHQSSPDDHDFGQLARRSTRNCA